MHHLIRRENITLRGDLSTKGTISGIVKIHHQHYGRRWLLIFNEKMIFRYRHQIRELQTK